MNRALYAAASGMAAQQQNLETIAGNLANADVAGFKGATMQFAGVASPDGEMLGTSSSGIRTEFAQGRLTHGGGPFDLAIEGEGFFAVTKDGQTAYTRDGQFSRSADGRLRNADGWCLQNVRIPADALSATVSPEGTVLATNAKGKINCGHIQLERFTAPEYLQPSGGTLFFATHESGKALPIHADASSGPHIRFGMLEQSNVSIVEAMMQILAAQRAYEANAKGVQAADEMMRIADNLQRG